MVGGIERYARHLGRLLATAALAVGLTVAAREIHVGAGVAGAADSNPGTPEAPLETISAAVKDLQPGDRVWIHAGVYREQVEYKAEAADWSAPIVVAAWPGDEVTVKGSDVVTGWVPHHGAIWKRADWAHNTQLLFQDGQILQQIGGTMVPYLVQDNRWLGRFGNDLGDMVEGSFYVDLESKVLYVWLKGGADPNAVLTEASVRPFLWVLSGRYTVVRGLRLMHSNTGAKVNWPAVRLAGSHLVFQDNEVSWCDFIGVGLNGEYIDLIDNAMNDCGNSGLGGNCYRGCRLIGNETSRNNWRKWANGWHSGGFKLIPVERHLLIERHRAFHNHCDGMWIDSLQSSNITINACESAYNQGNGLHYEIGQRGVVTNNLLHHNSGRGIYLSSSSDMLVAHNVCYANGMSGIVSHGVMRPGPRNQHAKGIVPARNNRIIGNIMMDNMNPALKPEGWSYRPELILPNPDKDPELFGGCFSDGNVYYRSDGRKIPFWYVWGEKVWHSLESWQHDTGNDRTSLVADPLFVDPAKGDFHLQPGSPAIGLVPVLGEVGDDADGKPRPYSPDSIRRAAGRYTIDPKLDARREPAVLATAAPAPLAQAAGPAAPAPAPGGALQAPDPAGLVLTPVVLPADAVRPLSQSRVFAALGKAVSKAHFHTPGLLFDLPDPAVGIEVRPGATTASVPLDRQALTLYLVIGASGQGKGICRIVRGDGITQLVTLIPGQTLGDSLTDNEPTSPAGLSEGCATLSLAWQGLLDGGRAGRLWLITYVNDNPWLPVLRLELEVQGELSLSLLAAQSGTRK